MYASLGGWLQGWFVASQVVKEFYSVRRGSVSLRSRTVLDNTLSCDARFLLMYMLALRDDAPKGYREMMATGMGETRARRALKELEARRHRWRFNVRVEGRVRTHTAVFEEPVERDEAAAWVFETFGHEITSCPSHPVSEAARQDALSARRRESSAQLDKEKPCEGGVAESSSETPSRLGAEFSRTQKSRTEKSQARLSNERPKEPKGSPPNQTRPARDDPPDADVGGGLVRSGLDRTLEQDTGDIAAEDWEILVDCLPAAMRRLEPSAVSKVARALRKRTEAGWRPDALRATLAGNSMPPESEIRNLAGLVGYRISQIPVNPPQRRKRSTAPKPPAAPEPPRERPLAFRLRDEARAAGHPDGQQSILWWLKKYPPGGSPDPEPPLEVAS